MRRNWIKLYVDQTLRGSCFDELLPDERFIWFGFLLLAGDSALEGKICITEKIGYTIKQLAELLKCKEELINRSIKKMVKFEKIKLYKNNVIKIVNWQKYQSEYQRQKSYRSNSGLLDEVADKVTDESYKIKLQDKVTNESDTLERDIDIERDKKKEKKEKNIYIDILNFWNSKKIIVHEKTDELLESIEKIIKKKKYKKDNIIEAIKNYSIVLDDKKYFFKYIWSLENFLSRKKALTSFLEGGESWENYKQQRKDRIAVQEAKIKEKEWEDKKEKRDNYKHKPIPKKIKEQIHKVLNIPDRGKK